MWGLCGPRKTLAGDLAAVIGISESMVCLFVHSCLLLCLFFTIHHLVYGVRADPTGTKLVSFFEKKRMWVKGGPWYRYTVQWGVFVKLVKTLWLRSLSQ